MSLTSEHPVSLEIPELGPYLGRLVAPPVIETGQRHWIPLEDIRYELVTGVFVRSGEAREWCAADDPDLTIATLGRSAWLGLWEQCTRRGEPARLAGDQRSARSGRGGIPHAAPIAQPACRWDPMRSSLSTRDWMPGAAPFGRRSTGSRSAAHAARAAQGKGPAAETWSNLLTIVARRLESAWLGLEEAAEKEWVRWARDVEEVRAWRRPLWPLVLISLLIVATATYVGLLLGGYLPVPGPLAGTGRMGVGAMELIGVGIDLVDIARVERMLERHGERVLTRFLTDGEREYVTGRFRPGTAHRRANGSEGGRVQGTAVAPRCASRLLAGSRGRTGPRRAPIAQTAGSRGGIGDQARTLHDPAFAESFGSDGGGGGGAGAGT